MKKEKFRVCRECKQESYGHTCRVCYSKTGRDNASRRNQKRWDAENKKMTKKLIGTWHDHKVYDDGTIKKKKRVKLVKSI